MSGQNRTWKLLLLGGRGGRAGGGDREQRKGVLFFSNVRSRTQTINFTWEKLFICDTIPGKWSAEPEHARGSLTYLIDLQHSYEKVSFKKLSCWFIYSLLKELGKGSASIIRKHFIPKENANQVLLIEISFVRRIKS